MDAAQQAQHQAIGTLYRDHRPWLLAWLRRNIACAHRAEDLTQDTFTRLLVRPVPLAAREPRAFLLTVAKGLLFDHFRRAALEQAYLEDIAQLPVAEQPSPETQQSILEDLKAIDHCLGKLSTKARTAFVLNRLDGLGHAAIAEQLGVSVPRVRQYLAQALRQCYIALYGAPSA